MWSKNNKCQYRDICPMGDEPCSHSLSETYSECDLYQRWSGDGNPCPYKDQCPDYPHLCLFANDLEACFKYGQYSGSDISQTIDEMWNAAKTRREEMSSDIDGYKVDEDNDDLEIKEKYVDEDEDIEEDDDDEEEDIVANDRQTGLRKSLELLHHMPQRSVFNTKQAFCFGKTYLKLYIREDSSGVWKLASKVKHQLQDVRGVLVPIRYQLYLWNNEQCYVLKMNRAVPLDMSFYEGRTKFSKFDENDIEDWQWGIIEKDKFINAYLCATGRNPLNTKVTDRESRTRNNENAIYELNNGSWKYRLDMNDLWILDEEIRKHDRLLNECKNEPATKKDSMAKSGDSLTTPLSDFASETGKSHVTAGLLAIFLGSFGAHKFYMGEKLKGFIYLAFFWTYIPFIIGVIEGIKYLTEGQEKFSERLDE